jgi:hypothetical protein
MERSSMDDMALVRQFVREDSEGAFRILARRHTDLIYSVALRQVQDRHLAEEVVQTVFILLVPWAHGNAVINWNVGTLQEAEDPAGPYTDLPAALSPYSPPPGPAARFYRLRQ